ncbi:MAG: hypothetical protein GZ085_02000 [Sulfuriferula multivorans]|uniref:Uncharacterized protein n=1 Tax=Sulfuriferula multivorans TaxID=1559896 RepID=A0A7C9NQ54_9PROT|nr:hypothetical protein [Sulfuriferula multivorans]
MTKINNEHAHIIVDIAEAFLAGYREAATRDRTRPQLGSEGAETYAIAVSHERVGAGVEVSRHELAEAFVAGFRGDASLTDWVRPKSATAEVIAQLYAGRVGVELLRKNAHREAMAVLLEFSAEARTATHHDTIEAMRSLIDRQLGDEASA